MTGTDRGSEVATGADHPAVTASRREPLSVVVPTRNRPERAAVAARCLLAALADGDELLVVDSASEPPLPGGMLPADPRLRLLRVDQPGAAVARNAGWRAARHELVGFVDDDVRVRPGWAEAMRESLDRRPDAGFVTGRTVIPPGQGTLAVAVKDDPDPASFGVGDAGLIGHSANLVVPRRWLMQVGGFDESLGAGARWRAGEDTDLFDRLLAAGATGCYEPAAVAEHDQWRRARQYVAVQHSYGMGSGARMAKLARTDRRRLRHVVAADPWRWGLRVLPGELARRDWPRAAGTLARLAGMLRGFVTAVVVPVRDGHLRRRPARSSS